jgi:predicted nuclease of predicted toxin-antitoxin system
MARLLVDEALPRSLVVNLRAAGHRADGIRELGLRGRSDEEVFRQARQLDAVLITSDLDFTNLARFPPASHKGIVLVRLPSQLSTSRLVAEIERGLREVPLGRLDHTIVIVEPTRTRIRRFEQ